MAITTPLRLAPKQARASSASRWTLSPRNIASKLGIQGGVSVTSVRPGSFADEIGIPSGTVILEINKKPIANKADFNAIVNGLKSGQDVAFKVRLQGANAPAGDTYFGGTLP